MSKRRMAEALGHVTAHADSIDRAAARVSTARQQFEDRDELVALLKGLEPSHATALRMSHLENRSYAEIAAALKMPDNSVGPLLSRARQKLQERRRVQS